MTAHKLFYYPYASFTNQQLPLLKVAALYFDKLIILDPDGASSAPMGGDDAVRKVIAPLRDAGILDVVTPADVLAKYDGPLMDAIRRDMADPTFLDLCDAHAQATTRRRWTLALAKVPRQLQTDQAMRYLMGDFAREVARDAGQFRERTGAHPGEFYEYAEFDAHRETDGGGGAYRCADFPLALGEAIMMNHALFTGLLHAGATPITDDPFHGRILAHKLQRVVAQEPLIRDAIAGRPVQRDLKAGTFVGNALREVNLPILDTRVPLDEVLEYRHKNPDALARVRATLGLMARRIEAEPWSDEFAREIDTRTIPDLLVQLDEARKARDAWLGTGGTRNRLTATGIAAGAAVAVLTLVTAPATPVDLAIAGLGVVAGGVIPGAEWLLDWRDGKKTIRENGLHYLLGVPA